jgi:hypothetical protein
MLQAGRSRVRINTGGWILVRHIIFVITTVVTFAIVEAAQQADLLGSPTLKFL